MALFGSSSPSYLILQSLDAANDRMADFKGTLPAFMYQISTLKDRLCTNKYRLIGEEPLKLTLCPKSFGYTGTELAGILEQHGLYPEFYDPDHVVLMLTPYNSADDLHRLEAVLLGLPQKAPVAAVPPPVPHPQPVLTPRQAILAESETLPIGQCLGRVSAAAAISCPPAIPLAVCGERIDRQVLDCLRYYGVSACAVVKE